MCRKANTCESRVRENLTSGLVDGMKPTIRCRRIGGFTLIELLMVITIIAILTTMLLPALKRAKDVANSVVCNNNLKSLGTSVQYYLNDYNSFFPNARANWPGGQYRLLTSVSSSGDPAPNTFTANNYDVLADNIGGISSLKKTGRCPNSIVNPSATHDCGYLVNSYLFKNSIGVNSHLRQVKRLEKIWMIFDNRPGYRDNPLAETYPHLNRFNIVAVDGHTQSYPATPAYLDTTDCDPDTTKVSVQAHMFGYGSSFHGGVVRTQVDPYEN